MALRYLVDPSLPHKALFMEMRLGKTLSAIRWIKAEVTARLNSGKKSSPIRSLVVAPLTVIQTWERELKLENEFYVNLANMPLYERIQVLREFFTDPEFAETRVTFLINYEGIVSMRKHRLTVDGIPAIALLKWDFVFLDESTKIKNPRTAITKICLGGFRKAKHRCILSGLPTPEHELELVMQMMFLFGEFMGCREYYQFSNRYLMKGGAGNKPIIDPKYYPRFLDEIRRRSFTMRRATAGIVTPKMHITRVVEMTEKQKELYEEIKRKFKYDNIYGEEQGTLWVITQFNWLARVAGGFTPDLVRISDTKMRELEKLITQELPGKSIVVWFRFTAELEYVESELIRLGYSVGVVRGSTPLEDRKKAIQQWKAIPGAVLLVMEKCGKFGIDLSNGDCFIYYSNTPSGEERAQSEERGIHPNKRTTTLIVDLVTKNTVDEALTMNVRNKGFKAVKFIEGVMANL